MSKIKLMPIELANMIAAGEVIERPSSVIKELVENAIDAEAKNIEIQIFNAGKDLIAVKDDGIGMDRIDAAMAFKRHASSKIKSVYDLARITTLGFRGEAIPSIAAVAKVKMQTSDGKEGTIIETSPDKEMKISEASLRKGTTFEIKELFFNTPARLKYLKSDRTEIASSIEMIERLAIGFPSIAFHLAVDGKEIVSTTGRGNLLETIARIYGNEIAKKCLPCSFESEEFSFQGFICHPSINYSNRYDMLTFMNNRYVYIPK
ncbi:MAG: DNA mismatch repair endonuclease MutL, partial [Bacilli bacterium]|nr:DNA mismatch repair endonuclease MutL [Bacilli bacterium]